ATFETPDIDKQIDYYQNVIGLTLVAREGQRAFLATNTGVLTIVLQKAAEQRCARLAFEVSPELSFDDMSRRLLADGFKSEIRSDALPGTSKSLAFTDPKGTPIDLFSDWSF